MSTVEGMRSLCLQVSNRETRNVKYTGVINFAWEIFKEMDSCERLFFILSANTNPECPFSTRKKACYTLEIASK